MPAATTQDHQHVFLLHNNHHATMSFYETPGTAKGKSNALDMPMVGPMPRCGQAAWRYHMAEKSPTVHPTRQRSVLTSARRQTGVDDQKGRVHAEPEPATTALALEEQPVPVCLCATHAPAPVASLLLLLLLLHPPRLCATWYGNTYGMHDAATAGRARRRTALPGRTRPSGALGGTNEMRMFPAGEAGPARVEYCLSEGEWRRDQRE